MNLNVRAISKVWAMCHSVLFLTWLQALFYKAANDFFFQIDLANYKSIYCYKNVPFKLKP